MSWSARNDLAILLAARSVLCPELVDFLTKLLDAFGSGKYRGVFLISVGSRTAFVPEQSEIARVETVFLQPLVRARSELEIDTGQIRSLNVWKRVDGLKKCLRMRRAVWNITWPF